ncbi:hypothetical protein [Novosphingobium sp.]|uniref:hypothetical protein n=1 Tax=Novosphingobium sp. TaxID=1874826 RepID=UPI0025EB9B3C|nr:hypothetical protein [Novosphingobium sp.]
MPNSPIQSPANFVPSRAAAYSDVDGTALLVSASNPLPVTLSATTGTATPSPLTGTSAVSGVLGPYQPAVGKPVILVLSGTWTGTVKVTRSTDGGTTKTPLTVAGTAWAQFTSSCCEAVWEESDSNARLYLDVTLTSGTLAYRMAQ